MEQKTLWTLSIITFFLLLNGCSSSEEKRDKAELYMQRGISLIEAGNYPSALRDLLAAEQLDPKNPVIQNNLGLTYFLREKHDLSIHHFSRAVDLNSNYTEARNNLARVYIESKEFDKAQEQLDRVFKDLTYPNLDGVNINQGLLYFAKKEYIRSQEFFLKALQHNPESCLAQSYYGRTFLELDKPKKAAEALDRAVSLCQRELFDEPHYYSAIAHYRAGEKDQARVRFEEVIKIYPKGRYREKSRAMIDLLGKGTL